MYLRITEDGLVELRPETLDGEKRVVITIRNQENEIELSVNLETAYLLQERLLELGL